MNTLSRYILKEVVIFFLITLFAFTGLLLTVRMLHFASLIINKGVEFSQIAAVFTAIIPTFLEIAIPMAALVGIMLAVARLSGDSEIIIIRASGISIFQLMRPILIFAIVTSLISLYVSVQLSPWGNSRLAQSLFEIARSKSTAGLSPGIFNKLGMLTIYAEKIDDRSGALERILIDDKRDDDVRKIVLAQKGRILSDQESRSIILQLSDGTIHEEIRGNYVLTHFSTNNLIIDSQQLFAGDESAREKKNKEMYLHEITPQIERFNGLITQLRDAGGDIKQLPPGIQEQLPQQDQLSVGDLKRKVRKLKTEYGKRFSMPFATFIMALLGLPLGIVPPRTQKTWGAGLSVALGLLVFTIYYVLLSLGMTFSENGKISPYLGLWIPNMIAGALTIYIIVKMGTEKWHSIAHGCEIWIERLIGRFKRKTAEA